MENNKNFALVTGASQGFGKALAYEIAKRKYNLILVALPNEGLDELALDLRKFGVEVNYYEVDLTIKEKLLEFTKWVNKNYHLSLLVNNAGIGGSKKILDSDLNYLDSIIKLNITATTMIIHQLLPNLLKHKSRAYILNVSSMAAYSPIPFKTVYPASKRFVHDFSRGLCHELRDSNVFVSVVHPGPMMTNANVTKRMKDEGFMGSFGILSPGKAARLTLNQMFREDASILLGWFNCILWLFCIVLPVKIKMSLVSNSFRKQASNASKYHSKTSAI